MKRAWALLVLTLLISMGHPVQAVMSGLTTEELVSEADLVVDGTVEQVVSRWSQDGRVIVSSATVAVIETVRGKTAKRYVTVEYPGGEIGDVGMKVSDMQPFNTGESVLLFLRVLRTSSEGEVHRLVGKAQGKYVIGKDSIARKSGYSLVGGNEIVDDDIDINELKRKVRNVR